MYYTMKIKFKALNSTIYPKFKDQNSGLSEIYPKS